MGSITIEYICQEINNAPQRNIPLIWKEIKELKDKTGSGSGPKEPEASASSHLDEVFID